MSEDQAGFPSLGDKINQEGSFGVGVNEGTVHQTVTNKFYFSPEGKSEQSSQKISPQAVTDFLQAIETRFKYLKLFHVSQEKVSLQDQYIPIEVTLERRYKHDIETTWGYAESEAELQKVYALKGMGEDTRKEQVKWEEARKKHQKLIVLADPGMGKSTLLKMESERIAREATKSEDREEESRIEEIIFPLFLRLSELAAMAGEMMEIVPELIKKEYASAAAIESLLREKLETGKCVLLLDALDEVPKEQRQKLKDKLKRFADNYDCSMVCTSRIVGYGGGFLDDAKEVEIVPFNKQQREAYITSWFTNAAEYLKDKTVSAQGLIQELENKPQISGLAQNPLLLSLLCSLYQEKELVLPARRCEVYTQAVEYMLFKWRNNHKPVDDAWVDAKEELLEEIAYCLSCEDKEVFSLRELRRQIDKFLKGDDCSSDFSHAKATDLIKELTQDDGIIQHLPGTDNKYLFLHRTFQEYFTASYLKRVIEDDEARGIELAKEHFWEFDWHETLSLLAGLLDNPLPLLAAIMHEKDDIFQHQLLLAGQCVAECEESEDELIEEVIERVYECWFSFESYRILYLDSWFYSTLILLGKTHGQMFKYLLQDLENTKSDVKDLAAEALEKITKSQAVKHLVIALGDSNSGVRRAAAEALEKIGDSQSIKSFIYALSDPNSDVRKTVAYTLGKIGDSQATSALIFSLSDSNSRVRRMAAEALGNIGDSQAIKPLISALDDSSSGVRREAAEALGNIGDSQVIKPLISALSDSDNVVRRETATALGKIGDSQAIKPLISALDDSSSGVRREAAEALEKIEYNQAIKTLISHCNHSNSYYDTFVRRKVAVEALGKIGDSQVISSLITALNHDENINVRFAAVEALGNIGDIQAISSLINALNHDGNNVRFAAVEALGNIGDSQAISSLINALNHDDNNVKMAAVKALGNIGDSQAISSLITALNHDDNINVRMAAVEALRNIGDSQAISSLITTFNHDDSDVRRRAIKALGKIGNLETLKQILQNPKINIYDDDIFPHIRKLAVRHSKEKVDFIPVYPETVDFLRKQSNK